MPPTILVIAQHGDVGAVALATLLRRRGTTRVTLVDAAAFGRSPVTHYPESGPPDTAPPEGERNPDGIDGDPDVVYCRTPGLEAPHFARAADGEYALAEMHAFGLSWLWRRREVVVNRPVPEALSGATPDVLRTSQACARVGLRTPDLLLAVDSARVPPDRTSHVPRLWPDPAVPLDPDALPVRGTAPPLAVPGAWVEPIGEERRRVLVAGDRTDAPAAMAGAVVALARELGLEVAEIRLAPSVVPDAEPRVMSVGPVPALAEYAQVGMLADHLERRAIRHDAGRTR